MLLNKVAIITTHPIQYYAPLFKLLTQRNKVQVKVFYTWGDQAKEKVFDPGFGKLVEWDIPLLSGYEYEFVKNIATTPGSSHFRGIINPGLINQIQAYQPKALLVFGWAFQSHLKVVQHFKGKIPIYFRGDSTLLDEQKGFSVKKLARRIFLKWVYRHIDKALYVGTNNKAYYKAHGLKEEQLVYTPHAIDNDRFEDKDEKYREQANEWKKTLNISDNKLIVLFAGKLEPKKNPMFLIEAAKQLPQMHFIIVGNGVLESKIKQATAALENMTWLPFQNQSIMPAVYRLADIFALPSQGPGETWGLAINEAMASGRIVIASNKCGGAIDLIKDGENGFVIQSNPIELINRLRQLLQADCSIEKLKEMSARRIKSFSLQKVASAIENTILQTYQTIQ